MRSKKKGTEPRLSLGDHCFIAILTLSILCVAYVLAKVTTYYCAHVLALDLDQHEIISNAGFALLYAGIMVIATIKISRLSESANLERQFHMRWYGIYFPFGLAIYALAKVLEGMRHEWHIDRSVYFAVAIIASAYMSTFWALLAKRTTSWFELFPATASVISLGILVFRLVCEPGSEGLYR